MAHIDNPLVDVAPGEPAPVEEPAIPLPSTDPFDGVDVNDPFVQQMLQSLERTHADSTVPPTPPAPPAEEEVEPPSPPEPAPVPPPQVAPGVTPGQAPSVRVGERDFTPEELQRAIEISQWAGRLNQQQAQFVDDVLMGRVQPYVQPAPAPAPAPAPEPEEEYIDPRAAAEITRIKAELETLKSQNFNVQQFEAQRRQTEWMAAVDRGVEAYTREMNLTTQEVQALSQITADMGIIPSITQRYQGQDQALAIREALDIAYWRTPEFRARSISAEVQTEVDTQQSELEALRVRKARAGQVGASSPGSAPRTTVAPDVRAMTPRDREAAIAGEVRKAMGLAVNDDGN